MCLPSIADKLTAIIYDMELYLYVQSRAESIQQVAVQGNCALDWYIDINHAEETVLTLYGGQDYSHGSFW